uniref:Enoyl reductase (ER) domain-containing protein n=1 Tax=Branchiostoma floridae TaxID=7739 RepID=C3Z1K9_BRAFL|eukprot:XP_002597615.1 hypothetical protein BRAFLDRAFT_123119 [Branchiostoma floridae]
MSRRSQKLVEYGKPLVLVTEQVPTAPQGGAVVQVACAGVCHSDIHATEGILQQQNLPLILGHEISGTVANMDPTVKTDVKVGDRVVVYSMGGCSACSRCAEGRPIDCLNRVVNTNGAFIDGGFSDYVVCPDAKLLLKVPDSVAMDTACLLPCSGLTAYNAVATIMPTVNDFARHTDCTVLLVGMGGLGLWAVQIAKQLLPSNVRLVCADVDGGIHAMVGIMAKPRVVGTIPLTPFVLRNHTLAAVAVGSVQQLGEVMALVASGKVQPPPISHHPLESAWDVIQKLKAGKVKGRAVLRLSKL